MRCTMARSEIAFAAGDEADSARSRSPMNFLARSRLDPEDEPTVWPMPNVIADFEDGTARRAGC